MKRKSKKEPKKQSYEITAPNSSGQIDMSWLTEAVQDGEILAIEPTTVNIVTVLDGELPKYPEYEKVSRKKNSCCDGVPIQPRCTIVNQRLNPTFTKLQVNVTGSHVCGIRSIAAYIALVTYVPLPRPPGLPPGIPAAIKRTLTRLRVGGQLVADAKIYRCPSNVRTRTFTASFPTQNFIGKNFAVVYAVKSCCNVSDIHHLDKPCIGHSGDRLII